MISPSHLQGGTDVAAVVEHVVLGDAEEPVASFSSRFGRRQAGGGDQPAVHMGVGSSAGSSAATGGTGQDATAECKA